MIFTDGKETAEKVMSHPDFAGAVAGACVARTAQRTIFQAKQARSPLTACASSY